MECPYGYIFGMDWEEHKECVHCDPDTWSSCSDEYDRIHDNEEKVE